jgi:hypothetical protein
MPAFFIATLLRQLQQPRSDGRAHVFALLGHASASI